MGMHRSVCRETRSAIITLLLRARRFNATLADGEGVPFAALAQREGVAAPVSCGSSASANLAPDITKAILDGRQPGDLTAEKLLEHFPFCRLPGTINGSCSALLEPDPNLKIYRSTAR